MLSVTVLGTDPITNYYNLKKAKEHRLEWLVLENTYVTTVYVYVK